MKDKKKWMKNDNNKRRASLKKLYLLEIEKGTGINFFYI